MATEARFDTSELVEFAQQITGASTRLRIEIGKVMKRGANNIKKDSQKRYRAQAGKHRKGHAWKYPTTINYDVKSSSHTTVAEIGPDKTRVVGTIAKGRRAGQPSRPGALGNLIEFGSAKNTALPHLQPALDEEVPKTANYLADALRKAVLG